MATVQAVEAELKRLGASESPEGQSALALARAIDSGRSLMAAPAMVKELRATLAVLREAAPKAKDVLDDLASARAKRRAG